MTPGGGILGGILPSMFRMRCDRLLGFIALAAVIAFVFWMCAFKIFDSDFFWHITAGRLMRSAGGLIVTDPFAYTREGLPYLANHEWLAQILLSLTFDFFGSTGVILLRGLLVTTAIVLVLLIGKKHIWIYAPLAMLGALAIRAGAMDRPHLWTWVMVAAFLFLSTRVLRKGNLRWRDVTIFTALQILWVNLHGGAALLGVMMTAALVTELTIQRRKFDLTTSLPVVLFAALLISPLGLGNITYISTLLTDHTTRFIAEWQPRPLVTYIVNLWPFWLGAVAAIGLARKHLFFSVSILIGMGILSRTAFRHEMPFVLVALAVTFLQLEESPHWQVWMASLRRHLRFSVPALTIIILGLVLYGRSMNRAFANRFHAHGYGIVDRTKDVANFLNENHVTGDIFNTYNLGSELLYHVFPARKVFVDGRNVDYGETFLSRLFAAADNLRAWQTLEQQYGFTIAIIDLADLKPDGPAPYVQHLQADPHWSLVYLDDHVALYLKDTVDHRSVIAKTAYRMLTPQNFDSGNALREVADVRRLESELGNSVEQSPNGMNARLLLARLLIAQGRTADAEPLIQLAVQTHPGEFRPWEVLGLLRAREGRLDDAEQAFDESLSLLTSETAQPIRAYIERVFEGLGQGDRAQRYH